MENNLKTSKIKDIKLSQYLRGEISLEQLKVGMNGSENYKIINGKLDFINVNKIESDNFINTITIVLTCHEKYLSNGWLYQCIDSIDNQTIKCNKILCLDSCKLDKKIKEDWIVLNGEWKNPNFARNEGLKKVKTEWVIFFDSDNIMPNDYAEKILEKINNSDIFTAIIYPDLFDHDINLNPIKIRKMQEYNYWDLRISNFCDTSSAWKKIAIDQVGGFPNIGPDDWFLARFITEKGWKASHFNGSPIIYRVHETSRCRETFKDWNQQMWENSTFTFVMAFSGRSNILDKTFEFLRNENFPLKTDLLFLDNSNDVDFFKKIKTNIDIISDKFISIKIKKINYKIEKFENNKQKHDLVARIYSDIFPIIKTDYLMILEDDVIPYTGVFREIFNRFKYGEKIGTIGCAYCLPEIQEYICATRSKDYWINPIKGDSLSGEFSEVGFVGGGCNIFFSGSCNNIPIYSSISDIETICGWDNNLCKNIRKNGWKILLLEKKCDHYINEGRRF